MVGRLAAIKRVDLFLAAMAYALPHLPGLTAVVVGDGAERPDLEKRARELGLEGRVRFVGHQVDVGPWLARARALVLSSDSEGLPLSVIEAMTAGLPVVVSHVGDLPDLVENGVNGFLVKERTPEAFSEKIVRLLRDEALRARFSEAARRAAGGTRSRRRPVSGMRSSRWSILSELRPLVRPPAGNDGGRAGPSRRRGCTAGSPSLGGGGSVEDRPIPPDTGRSPNLSFFDITLPLGGERIDWSRDYRSGRVAPSLFYGRIDYRDYAQVGDSKYTWELNRHQFLIPGLWPTETLETKLTPPGSCMSFSIGSR